MDQIHIWLCLKMIVPRKWTCPTLTKDGPPILQYLDSGHNQQSCKFKRDHENLFFRTRWICAELLDTVLHLNCNNSLHSGTNTSNLSSLEFPVQKHSVVSQTCSFIIPIIVQWCLVCLVWVHNSIKTCVDRSWIVKKPDFHQNNSYFTKLPPSRIKNLGGYHCLLNPYFW